MADMLRQRGQRMPWYRDELLHMARELGHRLLPAFNTTSGLPYPKVLVAPEHNTLAVIFLLASGCTILSCYFYVPASVFISFVSLCVQVNLRYGVLNPLSRTGTESDTCTACAGTMILEFAALSRLSGESIFEVLLSL